MNKGKNYFEFANRSQESALLSQSMLGIITEALLIFNYQVRGKNIVVTYAFPDGEGDHLAEIPLEAFEKWLQDNNKLTYGASYRDENGNVPFIGTLSLADYWNELGPEVKIHHLKQYMIQYYDPYTPDHALQLIETALS